eukprot:15125113-Alexandrium_andersonii.AAC.1
MPTTSDEPRLGEDRELSDLSQGYGRTHARTHARFLRGAGYESLQPRAGVREKRRPRRSQ